MQAKFAQAARLTFIVSTMSQRQAIPMRRGAQLTQVESDGLEDTYIGYHGLALIRSTSFRIARHEGRWWIIMGKTCRTMPFLSIK